MQLNKRMTVFEKDGYKCRECKSPDYLTIDHIIPLSRGGSNKEDNLQTLCSTCNSKKADSFGDIPATHAVNPPKIIRVAKTPRKTKVKIVGFYTHIPDAYY